MNSIRSIVAFVSIIASTLSCHAQNLLYPEPTGESRGRELRDTPWLKTLQQEVKPLSMPLGDQMPMIMWHGVGFAPLSANQIETLKQRGLAQHLQLDVSMIPAAKNLQAAGMPVILMEGRTDNWPYSLVEDVDEWSHQFPDDYVPPWFGKDDATQWYGACPNRTEGWKILERQIREKMTTFREAGITVDAVWVDYEGDPYPWKHLFDQVQLCKRCQTDLPNEVVQNADAWRAYSWRKYVTLYDRYFAKPIREVFPNCSVTNWHVVASTTANPIRYFVDDKRLPDLKFEYFNATNPIAYASDAVWRARAIAPNGGWTQPLVNQFYEKELQHQIKVDFENRRLIKRKLYAAPWVARFCKIGTGYRAPIMTRDRYRKSLAELWKYDLVSMQIFNPMHKGQEEYALQEVQDAVASLDRYLQGSESSESSQAESKE